VAREASSAGDDVIVVRRRFHGPPDSGQGGYVCGLFGGGIPGAAEVSLRMPPPLERPLAVEHADGGRRVLYDGDAIVAKASPSELDLRPPPAVGLEAAAAAVPGYTGFEWHAFPTCFACGPDREEADGLRLFPGPVTGRDVVACPWRPDAGLADARGMVRPEFVWAALDCPTAFACDQRRVPMVLARLTARIDGDVQAASPHVVMAWPLRHDGRKHEAACVICTPDAEVLACSRALWIEPRIRAPSRLAAPRPSAVPGAPAPRRARAAARPASGSRSRRSRPRRRRA
jgi:hypothetical protein